MTDTTENEAQTKKITGFNVELAENGYTVHMYFNGADHKFNFKDTTYVYTSLNKMFKDLKDTLKSE